MDSNFNENSENLIRGALGLSSEEKISKFFVTFSECSWMNGVVPCFGRVYPYQPDSDSFKILRTLENISTTTSGKPLQKIIIKECGQM